VEDIIRLLAIDDDPVVVAAMRALFSSWGATVGGGENAGSALAELRTLTKDGALAMPRFDLVVADLRLAQGRSGIDAVRELRQRSGSSAPALIVSGDTGEEARTSVSRAGFTLLSKPVVASKLQNAAAQALATARD
jgi:CheY-like chemotaxis protein